MKRILATGFGLAASVCIVGLAAAQSSGDKMGSSMKSMAGSSETIKLHAQHGSGEKGTATLMQHGDSLIVKLSLTGGSGDQPAHIHKGTCAKLDPKPAYPLTTVSDGASSTSLKGIKLSELTSGTFAINVHKSTTDLKDYVACGNLKVASTK